MTLASDGTAWASRRIVSDDGIGLMTRTDGPADASSAIATLLCCNSLGTSLEMWDAQIPTWASERRVLRYDHRGHGASDAPPPPYDLERLGRDALAVLDAHGIERADVCGLSLGGLVALWLAVHHPERVDRLILACTAARIGDRDGWEQRAGTVLRDGTGAIAPHVIDRFFSPDFRGQRPDTVAAVDAVLRATSDAGYAGCCAALADGDLRDALHLVRSDTLVIAASQDVATPPTVMRELQGGIGGSSWLEIEGAGHLANVERPETFGAAVKSFLSPTT